MTPIAVTEEWVVRSGEIEKIWNNEGGWLYRLYARSWVSERSTGREELPFVDGVTLLVYDKRLAYHVIKNQQLDEELLHRRSITGHEIFSLKSGMSWMSKSGSAAVLTMVLGADNDEPTRLMLDDCLRSAHLDAVVKVRFDLSAEEEDSNDVCIWIDDYDAGVVAFASMPITMSAVKAKAC